MKKDAKTVFALILAFFMILSFSNAFTMPLFAEEMTNQSTDNNLMIELDQSISVSQDNSELVSLESVEPLDGKSESGESVSQQGEESVASGSDTQAEDEPAILESINQEDSKSVSSENATQQDDESALSESTTYLEGESSSSESIAEQENGSFSSESVVPEKGESESSEDEVFEDDAATVSEKEVQSDESQFSQRPNVKNLVQEDEELLLLTSDEAHLKEFKINNIIDGTGPFDTDDDPSSPYYKLRDGNDENDHNRIVRSFDTIAYDIDFAAQPFNPEKKFNEAVICFEFVLPLNKDKAEWDVTTMSWMDPGSNIFEGDVTYDFDGDGVDETKTCQIIRGTKTLKSTGSQPTAIPGAGTLNAVVKVKNMLKGETVQPLFTGWIEHNQSGDELINSLQIVTGNAATCSQHSILEAVTTRPDVVTVTTDLRYNVQLLPMSDSYAAIGTYDFSTGNDKALDKTAGSVTGRADAFGITLQLYNNPDRGLKGLELPVGPITFDVVLETKFIPSAEGDFLTDEQQADVGKNYAPVVYTYGAQAEPSTDERPLGELSSYAVCAAPKNSGMEGLPSLSCYQGGTWNAQKNENVVSFTVDHYEIKYNTFPNGNLGDALNNDRYFNPRIGVQNIGCFSGGAMWVVTPFYNNGTTNPQNKGTFILDEYNKSGNFETSIKDINLRSSSQSGRELPIVTDNSNQTNREDDMAVRTVFISRGGEFDWRIAWTVLQDDPHSWAFPDVLERPSHVYGSWALTGQDVAVQQQDLAIGLGLHFSEKSDANNRVVATNILAKFDADVVELQNQHTASGVHQNGLEYKLLFATKADGSNWANQDEMNHATLEDLVFYSSMGDVPNNHACVGILAEVRPQGGDPNVVTKNQEGSRIMIEVGAKVRKDSNLVDNVYATVVGGTIYTREAWEACEGNIPSLKGNDPASPIELPQSTFTDYRVYEKAFYNDAGYAGGHTGNQNYGDSLRIQSVVPSIVKKVAQQEAGEDKSIYQMDSGQRFVDFVITPSLKGLPEGVVETTTLTIRDTLDKHLHYVDGTAFIGGTYQQHTEQGKPGKVIGGSQEDPIITINEDGNTVLTWIYENVSSADVLPAIRYTAQIGTPGNDNTDVRHNQTLTNFASVQARGDFRPLEISTGNLSKTEILVAKLKLSAISKIADQKYYNPGDGMGYELSAGNNGASTIREVIVLDTLPYSGDKLGSHFEGTLTVGDLTFKADALSNGDQWEAYYTTDILARDTVSAQYTADELRSGVANVSGQEIHWTKATIAEDGNVNGVEGKAITAFAFLGDLYSKEAVKAHVNLINGESQSGNLFINLMSQGNNQTAARIYVVQREISGVPWLDANKNGQRETTESPLYGVKVILVAKQPNGSYLPVIDKDGNTVEIETSRTESEKTFFVVMKNNLNQDVNVKLEAIAEANGSYRFVGVPAGDFGVVFASGVTKLSNFIASPVNVGYDLTDSDGVPLYSDGSDTYSPGVFLKLTQISDLIMPEIEDMLGTYFVSRSNDSGFYVDKTSVTAQKKWVGGSKVRPESVTFQLYRDGEYMGEAYDKTLPGDRDSKVTWIDLDHADDEGNVYSYTVKEVEVAGFTSTQTENVITNKYEVEKTSVEAEKKWVGGSKVRPESITFQLYRDGEYMGKNFDKTLPGDKDSSVTWSDLDKTDGAGNVYSYTVKEVEVAGFTSTQTENVITNKYEVEKTSVEAEKKWVGGSKVRPESITFQLYRDGEYMGKNFDKILPGDKDSSVTWSDLDKTDGEGNVYSYTVKEVEVAGFTASQDGNVITNKYEVEKTSVEAEKKWVGGNKVRPESVTFQLYRDGEYMGKNFDKTLPGDKDSSVTWSDLDKTDGEGNVYSYTVKEVEVAGFTSTQTENVITNKYEVEKTSVEAEKKWVGGNKVRPESVTFQLYRDGEYMGEAYDKILPGDKDSSVTWTDLDKTDGEGNVYSYTVKEVEVAGFTSTQTENVITNKYEVEKTSVEAEKKWVGGNTVRPESVTFQLYRDGEYMGETYDKILPGDKDSSVTWTDLDHADDEGNVYSYTVKEVEVAGFTASQDGNVITNTFNDNKISVEAEKKWVGDNTVRPESVTFQLYRDGEYMGETYDKTLPGDKDSSVTWTDLDHADDEGNVYSYTVKEVEVAGFTASQDGNVITNTFNDNKISVEAEKKWVGGNKVRPESVTFQLYRDGEYMGEAYDKILPGDRDSKVTWIDLDHADDEGNVYSYTVKEVEVAGFTASQDGNVITNTCNDNKISVEAEKKWVGGNTVRPESVTFQLYRDGEYMGEAYDKILPGDRDSKVTWTDLDRVDSEGHVYIYSVEEVAVESFAVSRDGNTFTNTYKSQFTDIVGRKIWAGHTARPEIYFTLYQNIKGQTPQKVLDANGQPYIVKVVDDKATFDHVPLTDQEGNKLIYSVKETDKDGNDYVPTGFMKREEGLTVTNTYTPLVRTGEKKTTISIILLAVAGILTIIRVLKRRKQGQ